MEKKRNEMNAGNNEVRTKKRKINADKKRAVKGNERNRVEREIDTRVDSNRRSIRRVSSSVDLYFAESKGGRVKLKD